MRGLYTLSQNRLRTQLLVLMATAAENATSKRWLTLHKYVSCTLGERIMMMMIHLSMFLKLEVNVRITTLIVLQNKGLIGLVMGTLRDSFLPTEATLGS